MSEEPRRSGRATKGQHTKNQEVEPPPLPKPKRGKSKATKPAPIQPSPEENEDDSIVRCVCGATEDEGGRMMIECDSCNAWQHNICMGITEVEKELPEHYLCELCKPEDHKGLLEAMAHGEKPWEERERQRAEEERRARRRKGKKGRGGRQSKANEINPKASEEITTPKPQKASPPTSAQDLAPPSSPAASPAPALTPTLNSTPVLPAPKSESIAKKSNTKHEAPAALIEDKEVSSQSSPTPAPSLIGEKRRHPSTPEDVTSKRRKSSQHELLIPSSTEVTLSGIEHLPDDRKRAATALHKTLKDLILSSSQRGLYRIPDGETPDSLATHFSLRIEAALLKHYGSASGYSVQLRSIAFNVRKNPELLLRLVQNSVTPDELSTMSSDDMASEEKQREYARLKEQAEKQAILVQQEGPRIRKTHKGEELIENEDTRMEDAVFSPAPIRRRESLVETPANAGRESPVDAASPNMVELPEDTGARRPLAIDTTAVPKSAGPDRPPQSAFDIEQVWSSVHSPDHDHSRALQQQQHRRQSSIIAPAQPTGALDDADIDRLLKDEEDNSMPHSPADLGADPSVVWQGQILMQSVAGCTVSARFVAGGNIGMKLGWTSVLPQSLLLSGRIPTESADQYVGGMRSTPYNDVAVLLLTPSGEHNQGEFNKLFDYFQTRNRWGVISNWATFPPLRDAYLVPIEAGDGPLPSFLQMLEDNYLNQYTGRPRPENVLLLLLVCRTRTPPSSTDMTPRQQSDISTAAHSGPSQPNHPSHQASTYPLGHPASHSPQFSPVTGQGNTNGFSSYHPSYGSSYQGSTSHGHVQQQQPQQRPFSPPLGAQNPIVAQILGPFLGTPVVNTILSSMKDVNNESLIIVRNLRDILEKVPSARTDLAVLQQELSKSATHG